MFNCKILQLHLQRSYLFSLLIQIFVNLYFMLFCFGHLRRKVFLLCLCLLYFCLTFSSFFEFLSLGELLFLCFESCQLLSVLLDWRALLLCFKVQLAKSFENEFSSSFNLCLFQVDVLLLIFNFILFVSNFFLFVVSMIYFSSAIS